MNDETPGKPPSAFEMLRAVQLLAELTPHERDLVREVLTDYPALPVAKAIKMLKEAGM